MRLIFVLNDLSLSGGINVVLQHASRLASRHTHSVSIALRDSTSHHWPIELISGLEVLDLKEVKGREWDVAIATYWETILLLGEVAAKRYVWFCQQYEDRFFPDRNPSVSTMQIVGAIPIPVITEAHWLKELLHAQNPTRKVTVVRNGIDKNVFCVDSPREAPTTGLRVLVEGPLGSIVKNTEYAIEGALHSKYASKISHIGNRQFSTRDPRYEFVKANLSFAEMSAYYRASDVLLKTSRAEGMVGPPLEALHCGTPFVSTPVTGIEEYAIAEENSLTAPWDDAVKIGQTLDRLVSEPQLWERLHRGALVAASRWPDWDAQAAKFNSALAALVRRPTLAQADLRALSETILHADMMHWLAMRGMSDRSVGIGLLEKHLAHQPSHRSSYGMKISNFARKAVSAIVGPKRR